MIVNIVVGTSAIVVGLGLGLGLGLVVGSASVVDDTPTVGRVTNGSNAIIVATDCRSKPTETIFS